MYVDRFEVVEMVDGRYFVGHLTRLARARRRLPLYLTRRRAVQWRR